MSRARRGLCAFILNTILFSLVELMQFEAQNIDQNRSNKPFLCSINKIEVLCLNNKVNITIFFPLFFFSGSCNL